MASFRDKTITDVRRDIHAHPETGWKEFRTTALIADELEARGFNLYLGPEAVDEQSRMGVPEQNEIKSAIKRAEDQGAPRKYLDRMCGVSGLVAVKQYGSGSGPTVGIRVDMDALPRAESMDEDHEPVEEGFVSKHSNVMHACGHDAHTAIGLGLARELDQNGGFDGTLKMFFQPAEEGGRGGEPMSRTEHVTDVDHFMAVHVGLDMETGVVVGARDHPQPNAKMDVVFTGKGSHAGGAPEKGKNALLSASTAIQNLYGIPRHGDGGTRINVGHVHSPNPQNIVPEHAEMRIEVRGEETHLSDYMEEYAERIVEHAAAMHDVEYELELYGKTATFSADRSLAAAVVAAAEEVPSVTEATEQAQLTGSEDASFLIQQVQNAGGDATYVGIGASNPFPHHHPKFDIDEDAIDIGIECLASTIRSL